MHQKVQTICTIGPACFDFETLEQLVISGMDIARFNFSHATYDQFTEGKKILEELNKKHDKTVKTLIDLRGPRIRIGELPKAGVELKEGELILFSTDSSNKEAIPIDDPYLHLNVKENHPMFLSNGDIELIIENKHNTEIIARVIRGGVLYSRKAVNLPDTNLTTAGLTEKDRKDTQFAVSHSADYIAQSFVKNKSDVEELRPFLKGTNAQIIAKIESKQAIHNLAEIIQATDLVMVARGDLGIELPLEKLPLLQKDIISQAKKHQKRAIVATQMLMSMVNHFRPTRAEVSDVANAVLDGAWGLMLSDETAFGRYPVESLVYLIKTIRAVEESRL